MRQFAILIVSCLAVLCAGFAVAAVTSTNAARTTTYLTVHVREWSFDLSQTTVPTATVVFTAINDGPTEPHDFAVGGSTSAVLRPRVQ
ncbi:MAG: hypothetical protein ACYDA3_09700 [Gaiellaceae bacterium]